MTQREAIELRAGLQGAFGKWLMARLRQQSEQILGNAIEFIPTNLGEMNEREQNLGRGKALAELVIEIPNTIDELIRNTPE